MKGKIYMIPTFLDADHLEVIPAGTKRIALELKYIITENIRSTRRYLKALDNKIDINSIQFYEWNKHTDKKEVMTYLQPALEGYSMGVFSEAGCPGIADPGRIIVSAAHQKGIQVVPLTGPSSIILALMASGMSGQQFRFHGYLPIEETARRKKLLLMQSDALRLKETQIFMETPFRNNKLLRSIVQVLKDEIHLCIAVNITGDEEKIRTKKIRQWKNKLPDLHKQPAIFLIH